MMGHDVFVCMELRQQDWNVINKLIPRPMYYFPACFISSPGSHKLNNKLRQHFDIILSYNSLNAGDNADNGCFADLVRNTCIYNGGVVKVS